MSFWRTVRDEVREVIWLASVVGALSVLGITLAVVVRLALHA
jgi:hypothetical protein